MRTLSWRPLLHLDGYLSGYQIEVAGGRLCALILGVWYISTFVLQRAWDLGSEDPSSSSGSPFYYLQSCSSFLYLGLCMYCTGIIALLFCIIVLRDIGHECLLKAVKGFPVRFL